MEEEKKSNRGLLIGLVTAGVLTVAVGAYLVLRSVGCDTCKDCDEFNDGHQVSATFNEMQSVPAPPGDATFSLEGFCDVLPDRNYPKCVALWKINTLGLSGYPAALGGSEVTILFENVMDRNHTGLKSVLYKLGSGSVTLTDTLFVYEDSKAWVNLNVGNPRADVLRLTLGGLCIVENIDGGDIDTKSPSDTHTEPVMAKTGGVDTTKVKSGS